MSINKDIQDKLKTGVEQAFKDLKPYLDMMAKQYQYSIRNTILICTANPKASIVGGYQKLLNEYDHQVRKGEKAISIIAPDICSTKSDSFIDMLDKNIDKYGTYAIGGYGFSKSNGKVSITGRGLEGYNVTDLKSFIKDKIGDTVIIGFKSVNVFDISQTNPVLDKEGNPTPKAQAFIDALEGEKIKPVKEGDFEQVARLFNAASLTSHAASIEITEILERDTKGYFSRTNNFIVINEQNTFTQSLKTLIHEEAHCRIHSKKGESQSDEEIQAEAIAYVVMQHYGVDTSDYSFAYVANWSENKEIEDLIKNLEVINKTSTEIIKNIDEKVEETKEMDMLDIICSNPNMQNDMFLYPIQDYVAFVENNYEYPDYDLEM